MSEMKQGPRQLDYAGELMPVGETRDPQETADTASPVAWRYRHLRGDDQSWKYGGPDTPEKLPEGLVYAQGLFPESHFAHIIRERDQLRVAYTQAVRYRRAEAKK